MKHYLMYEIFFHLAFNKSLMHFHTIFIQTIYYRNLLKLLIHQDN
jgi:hypothetical protein